jgi:cell division protein FtsB
LKDFKVAAQKEIASMKVTIDKIPPPNSKQVEILKGTNTKLKDENSNLKTKVVSLETQIKQLSTDNSLK